MRTSTAEALSRLDMVGAVRDHRRFNYVCKVTITSFVKLISTLLCSDHLQVSKLNSESSKYFT